MKFNRLVLGCLILWGFSGCGGNPREGGGLTPKKPNPQSIKPQAQGPSSVNLSAEIGSEPKERPFNPEGTPDPFQSPAEELFGGINRKGGVMPLEQFEVSDYQLVGIVSGPGFKKALIQDLTGKGFFVVVGTRIGKGGGKIIKITDKEVLVDEPSLDLSGRKKNRRIALKIPGPLL
jgi:hypothetical protein